MRSAILFRFYGQESSWQLYVGGSGNVDLPRCDVNMYEVPQQGDTSQVLNQKLWGYPAMSFGAIRANPGYVNPTEYGIQGGPGKNTFS